MTNPAGANSAATQALRARSPELLREGLLQELREGARRWGTWDSRDLMVALAPFHDCARRLGVDVAALFADAAEAGPSGLSRTLREFGQRRKVRLGDFGWVLDKSSDGPEYWYLPYGVSPRTFRKMSRDQKEAAQHRERERTLRWLSEDPD